MKHKIIVTIPAYNEEKTINKVIKEIHKVMNEQEYNYEILVLNDGSKDNTKLVAEKEKVIVISHKRNRGLAETFKSEMKECISRNADIIIHTDADGQYLAQDIPRLINKLVQEDYDLVLGSRFGKGTYSGTLLKKMGNIAFARVFSSLLKTKITDTTTGFRAFTKEIAEMPLINNFTYTQEQLIRAGKKRLKVGEISIKTRKTRKSKLMKNPFDYAIKAWLNIFRVYRDFEPIKFFSIASLLFFVPGLILGLRVLYIFILTGTVGGKIPSLLLCILLISIGFQTGLIGFLADIHRK